MLRVLRLLMIASLLAGCSNSLLSKPKWLKNPFSKEATQPAAPANLPTQASQGTWYCLGDLDDKSWNCAPGSIADPALNKPPLKTKPAQQAEEALTGVKPMASRPGNTQDHQTAETDPVSATEEPATVRSSEAWEPSASSDDSTALAPRLQQAPEMVNEPFEPADSLADLERNNRYLNAQPGDYFAAQLLAVDDLTDLLEYASSRSIERPLFTRIEIDRGEMYVLLLGVYATRSEARAAADSWSAGNPRDEAPWIRQMDGLHAALAAAGE